MNLLPTIGNIFNEINDTIGKFTAYQIKQNRQLSLVTCLGMAESEKGSSSSVANSRQEEDKMLAQMEEDERLLDESDGKEKKTTTEPKEKATEIVRISSVGTLAKNFMKNVRVGSNDVFAAPATVSSNNATKTASSRVATSAGAELVSGLPGEYEMVKAAR